MIITRSDSGQTGLQFVSPERLEELAGNGHAEHPDRVNGTKLHPHCPHCDEDGQD